MIRPPSKQEFIIAFVILLVWFLMVKIGVFESNEKTNGKVYYKPLVAKEHSGIITAKYIDKENHSYSTIEFRTNDSLDYYYILMGKSEDALYNFIRVDDSIIDFEFEKVTIKRGKVDSLFCIDI